MNKYLTEFIGMFFFVLTVGCAVIGNSIGALAPLAIEILESQRRPEAAARLAEFSPALPSGLR